METLPRQERNSALPENSLTVRFRPSRALMLGGGKTSRAHAVGVGAINWVLPSIGCHQWSRVVLPDQDLDTGGGAFELVLQPARHFHLANTADADLPPRRVRIEA